MKNFIPTLEARFSQFKLDVANMSPSSLCKIERRANDFRSIAKTMTLVMDIETERRGKEILKALQEMGL